MFDFDKFKEDCGGFTNCLLCPFEKSCTDAFKDPENDEPAPCERWKKENAESGSSLDAFIEQMIKDWELEEIRQSKTN